jgi:hypothetical protein
MVCEPIPVEQSLLSRVTADLGFDQTWSINYRCRFQPSSEFSLALEDALLGFRPERAVTCQPGATLRGLEQQKKLCPERAELGVGSYELDHGRR